MILSHFNLTWDVASPSHWRLVLPRPHDDTIDLSYLGAGSGLSLGAKGEWCLFHDHQGDVKTCLFPSRDSAVAMVAQAFRNEGMP